MTCGDEAANGVRGYEPVGGPERLDATERHSNWLTGFARPGRGLDPRKPHRARLAWPGATGVVAQTARARPFGSIKQTARPQ